MWHLLSLDSEMLDKATNTLVTAFELKATKSQPMKYARKMRLLRKTLLPEFVSFNDYIVYFLSSVVFIITFK